MLVSGLDFSRQMRMKKEKYDLLGLTIGDSLKSGAQKKEDQEDKKTEATPQPPPAPEGKQNAKGSKANLKQDLAANAT